MSKVRITDCHIKSSAIEFLGDAHINSNGNEVYHGKCNASDVCVEVVKQRALTPEEENLWIHFMGNPHPNIGLCMGLAVEPDCIKIVREYLPKSVESKLLSGSKTTLWERFKWAEEVAKGVIWLQEVKPAIQVPNLNLSHLQFDGTRVKVTEFDPLASKKWYRKQFTTEDLHKSPSLYYLAPEVFQGGEITDQSATYGFGILIYELCERKRMFNGTEDLSMIIQTIYKEHKRPDITHLPMLVQDLIRECWHSDPKFRIPFSKIPERVASIITHLSQTEHSKQIDEKIKDKNGSDFWKKYFLTLKQVSWKDFLIAFSRYLQLHLMAAEFEVAISPGSAPGWSGISSLLKCYLSLRALLCNSKNLVTLEQFGNILSLFGPLEVPVVHNGFLTRVRDMITQKWFHGDISSEAAENLLGLSTREVGTFLIRFSSTPGSYCLSVLSPLENGSHLVRHMKIPFSPGSGFLYQSQYFPTINDIVNGFIQHGSITQPCPGSKYQVLLEEHEAPSPYIQC